MAIETLFIEKAPESTEKITAEILADLPSVFPGLSFSFDSPDSYKVFSDGRAFILVWVRMGTASDFLGHRVGCVFAHKADFETGSFIYLCYLSPLSEQSAKDVLFSLGRGYHAGYLDACSKIKPFRN